MYKIKITMKSTTSLQDTTKKHAVNTAEKCSHLSNTFQQWFKPVNVALTMTV